MSKKKILVVDDEETILTLIEYNLSKEGYSVKCAATGEEALSSAKADPPDLVLLDLMLPGLDGIEVAKALKRNQKTADVPIIMLTAKSEDSDIVSGLEIGADDYITKPFSTKVLIARIRAALRRASEPPPRPEGDINVHDLIITPAKHQVLAKGKPVSLTASEFRILLFLAGRPGWVFSRDQIIDAIRGENYAVTDRSIDVQIVSLRKKLGSAGKYIETVRGVGYRFKE